MIQKILSFIVVVSFFAASACTSAGFMTGTEFEGEEVTKLGTPTDNEPAPENLKNVVTEYLGKNPKWEGESKTDTIYVEFKVSSSEILIFTWTDPTVVSVGFSVDDSGNISTDGDRYILSLSISEEKIDISDAAGSFDAGLKSVIDFDYDNSHAGKNVEKDIERAIALPFEVKCVERWETLSTKKVVDVNRMILK